MIGTPTYSEAAITTVTTFANLLLQTGLKIGQITKVTYGGKGRSLWRYNGGGESTATNWSLISPASVYKAATTGRHDTVTFADDPDLVIDWLPIGIYEISFSLLVGSGSATPGFKWKFVAGGTAAAVGAAALGLVPSQFFASASFQVVARNTMLAGDSYDDVSGQDYASQSSGIISVTAAGTLALQWAQKVSNGTDVNLEAGSRVIVFPLA